MKFNPTNLREIGDEHARCLDIRADKGSTLILCKSNGDVSFATGLIDKDTLIREFNEKKDLLIWAWRGQWKTDMFKLTKSDIEKHYK